MSEIGPGWKTTEGAGALGLAGAVAMFEKLIGLDLQEMLPNDPSLVAELSLILIAIKAAGLVAILYIYTRSRTNVKEAQQDALALGAIDIEEVVDKASSHVITKLVQEVKK